MSARTPPKPGWITVADAAAALTAAGDPIDASNVSRYLARNPEVPQERCGKFRFVDLSALKAHRSSSVFVADKREARDLEDFNPAAAPAPVTRAYDPEDEAADKPGSPLTQGKLELQQIELRKRRREEDVEEGRLVPVEDVQVVVSAVMGAFMGELARQEQTLTGRFGRDVGAAVRLSHRAARAAASAQLIAAVNEQLSPAAAQAMGEPPSDAVAVA